MAFDPAQSFAIIQTDAGTTYYLQDSIVYDTFLNVHTGPLNESFNPSKIQVVSAGSSIDSFNSTTTPLLANAAFTGPWMHALNYVQLQVVTYTDQNSATNGLQIQFSGDRVNVDHEHAYTVDAATGAGDGHVVSSSIHATYYRIVFTNGAVNQTTFRLNTMLRPSMSPGSTIEVGELITASDDALLTKTVLAGQNLLNPNHYIDIKATPDGGVLINQNIQIDAANSSTSNLASGVTFTGATTSNITASMIQIFLKTDQNCTVILDQSQDGTNFDISDSFNFYASIGNFGINVGAFGAYFRVRVTNTGTATTTYFRLQTIFVPIANQLPRTLDRFGFLQTAIKNQEDAVGHQIIFTPHGEQLSVPTILAIGQTFSDASLDTIRWTASAGTGGTVAESNGVLTLQTGTTADNAVSIQSVGVARFIGGQPNIFATSMSLPDTGIAGNTRRGGPFTTANGTFFELNGTTFRIATRKGGADTYVNNGSFNGLLGSTVPLDTNLHNWKILYHVEAVEFYLDDILLHTFTPTPVWYNNIHLPIRFENFNSGGLTTNVSLNMNGAIIVREGYPYTQPHSTFLQNAQTTTVKSAPGELLTVQASGITNNSSIILYDSLAGSGTVLWNSGTFGAQTVPFEFSFDGVPFDIGMTIVITGTINVTLIYR